jgi:hypothetical protein
MYGYTNKRTCGGCTKDGVGVCRHPSVRVPNAAEAAVVRRIFEMTRDGLGLAKIRRKLNDEGVPGPRGRWARTGVREILHRRDYKGEILTNRTQRSRDADGNAIRVRQDESEWKARHDETLRIVSDKLWDAAHARVERTRNSYLRRGHQLVGQVESTKGLYLLSGMLSCGVCGGPMIAMKRGRNLTLAFVCRDHRERDACANATGVPMAELNEAVIASLRETFSVESFTRHLQLVANDNGAREQRAAERSNLLAEIPKLAAIEARLVKRMGLIEDDELVGAMKAEWNETKSKRVAAESRVAELEGIERDIAVDKSEVEALRETWKSWSETLVQATEAAPGSIPAEAQAQARQILKKVLVGTISVVPSGFKIGSNLMEDIERGVRTWYFYGWSRFEGVIAGGAIRGEGGFTVQTIGEEGVIHRADNHPIFDAEGNVRVGAVGFDVMPIAGVNVKPISGGSDSDGAELAVESTVQGPDMAPHTPQRSEAPRQSRGAPRQSMRKARW